MKFTSVRAVRGILDEPLHDLSVLFCDLAAGDDVFLAIKSDSMDSSRTINSLLQIKEFDGIMYYFVPLHSGPSLIRDRYEIM